MRVGFPYQALRMNRAGLGSGAKLILVAKPTITLDLQYLSTRTEHDY